MFGKTCHDDLIDHHRSRSEQEDEVSRAKKSWSSSSARSHDLGEREEAAGEAVFKSCSRLASQQDEKRGSRKQELRAGRVTL